MIKARLDHDDRINLQVGIGKGYSLAFMQNILHKNRSTIYREITNNCYYKDSRHTCAHCKLNCLDKQSHYKNGECQSYEPYICKRLKKFSYTCNNCEKARFCNHMKRFYDCIEADKTYTRNRKFQEHSKI